MGFGPSSTLAIACKGQIRLWDPGTRVVRTLGSEADPAIFCGAISPDGSLLATGASDQTVCVWSTTDLDQVLKVIEKR